MLFDSFEAYDVQEIRRISREEGEIKTKIKQICKKLQKGKSEEQIADELEEDLSTIQEIIQIVKAHAPNYDIEQIYQELEESKEEHQYAEYQ